MTDTEHGGGNEVGDGDACHIHPGNTAAACRTSRCGACARFGKPHHTLSLQALCVESSTRRATVPASQFHGLPTRFVTGGHRCGCARYLPNDAFVPSALPWLPDASKAPRLEGAAFVVVSDAKFVGAMMDVTYAVLVYMEPTPPVRPFRRVMLHTGVTPSRPLPIKLLSTPPRRYKKAPPLLPFQEQLVRRMLKRLSVARMASAVLARATVVDTVRLDGRAADPDQRVVLLPSKNKPGRPAHVGVRDRREFETHVGVTWPVETVASSLARPQLLGALHTVLKKAGCGVGGQLVLPTGYGKTVIGVAFLRRLKAKFAVATPKLPKLPSLVVCPPIVVPVWLHHLALHAPGLTVAVNAASKGLSGTRNPDTKTMQAADVVVTTYGCVSRREALRAVPRWGAVVLDENHMAPRSGTFPRWLAEVPARCKWGLTADGPAVARSVWPMLRDTKVSRAGSRVTDCVDLDACWTLAPPLCYTDGTPLLALPAPTVVRHDLGFASAEERLLYGKAASVVVETWRRGPTATSFWKVCRALSYHPFQAAELSGASASGDRLAAVLTTDVSKALDVKEASDCPVCMAPLVHAVAPAVCSHVFCKACLGAWLRRNDSCPLCRTRVSSARLVTLNGTVIGGDGDNAAKGGGMSTTKMAAVLDLITGSADGDKFLLGASSPASVLAMVSALNDAGVKAVGISKLHPPPARLAAVAAFSASDGDSSKVMVLEYEFAGFGLSLTAANHVVVMEALLPRDTRAQFVGRAQRLGQTRPVTVHVMSVAGTVETSGLAAPATARNIPYAYMKRFVNHLRSST